MPLWGLINDNWEIHRIGEDGSFLFFSVFRRSVADTEILEVLDINMKIVSINTTGRKYLTEKGTKFAGN